MSEYVTVVSVDLQQPKMTVNAINSAHNEHEKKSSFVTVLSINNNQNTTTISTAENPNDGEIVTVYRLPGERLGFGLKFQGGTKTNEKVQRLYIQSCDPESPASKARASWGQLGEGDEVLEIDGEPVTGMTRIECVKCLKDRNVAINLLVKKRDVNANSAKSDSNIPKKRPLPPPPPMVPPRKINKKPPPREPQMQAPIAAKVVDIPTPVVAEMYLNTLDDEINRNDESDETGSTISSQISVISNFSSESDLSFLSATTSSSEFSKILAKPFQMIEREFNVNTSTVLPSMSFDNLLLFNDSEPIDVDGVEKAKIDAKPLNAYENYDVNAALDDQRQYENIDIKLPPIPRPRSISMPIAQDACEIDSKTPTKTIESWLNDANTINGNALNGDKAVPSDDHEQNYEPIKFECFAAGDDDDEKLGPPELLNISEAYFNFSWCGNSPNNLPTIGEAEEEFSSMEPNGAQNGITKVAKGPIFIVNTIHDSETDNDGKLTNEIDSRSITQNFDTEINNNNFPYLKCEDKGDKNDKPMQCENKVSQIVTVAAFSREKIVEKSLRGITAIRMEANKADENEALSLDSDESTQSLNEAVTQCRDDNSIDAVNESAEKKINIEKVIKTDSERLGAKCADEADAAFVTSEVPIVAERRNEVTQSTNATTTESKEMTSLPTPPVHQFAPETHMKQLLPDRRATENSRLPPDGHEFPVKKLSNGKHGESDNNTIDSIKSPLLPTTKATAIVAPLVPRKMHNFDEITNFVDTKPPPFKSATMGRQRPINWRNKDEKSEKSVKDKIAMFSNSTSDISPKLPKSPFKDKSHMSNMSYRGSIAKSTENIFSSSDVGSAKSKVNECIKKKAMSVENLDDYDDLDNCDIELNYKPVSKRLHSPAMSARPLTLNIGKAQSVENLIEPCESPMLPSRPPPTAPPLSRRISFSGYTDNQAEENRQKSITNILENRKKSMSKLRGLVIPDKVPENELHAGQKVLGLPVIRSKECELINNNTVFNRSVSVPVKSFAERKYGFEVQSQVKVTPRRLTDSSSFKAAPVKPPRTSLILTPHKTVTTDESDTESCMSSRVSTPPVSPVAKKPLTRTVSSETNTSISSNSTLTSGSGSQASCSSNGSTPDNRNNKSTETVSSRKSILASSKSRSGRDCLEKSWRDEDSTDGGIDNDDRRRVPKAKTRSCVNYKVVSAGDNVVDKVINVATYVEVISSDSDDKPEASEIALMPPVEKNVPMKKETPQLNIMSDMAKWVRSEATKTIPEVKESVEVRVTPKVLEPLKKLNLSEIRKNFENKAASAVTSPAPKTPKEKPTVSHNRFSSWDSVASSSSGVSSELLGTGTGTNNSESLQTLQSDFGSFSSFGSSHSLITPQDLQLIIDEADPALETPEAFVVVLQRESPESSIGITLAGGSDYEAKEITIHRILTNSPADKDGRLKRGDRLLSINGLSMRGLTHRESLSVLKSPRNDVVMVVTRSKSVVKTNSLTKTKRGSLGSLTSLTEKNDSLEVDGISMKKSMQTSKSMDMDLDAISNEDSSTYHKKSHQNGKMTKPLHDYKPNDINKINIVKDGAGLGFSIDGGYDSPSGNLPLVIKKIFMGGAAERSSNIKVGDEILEINGSSIARQTRIDVWNMIKKLPQGDAVQITIKRK